MAFQTALQALTALAALSAAVAVYVPTGPVTNSYAMIASMYGITLPEAAAGINPNLPATDPRIAQSTDVDLPEQIHIMYHSSQELVVTWFTGAAQLTNDTASPFVVPDVNALASAVRVTRGNHVKEFHGEAQYYRMTYPYGADRPMTSLSNLTVYHNYTSGVIHRVTLKNLLPGKTYYYQVGDFKKNKISPELKFRTLPKTSKTITPVKLGFFADIAISINSTRTVERLVAAKPHFVALVGDFAYANIFNDADQFNFFLDERFQFSHGTRWDQLGRMLAPIMSTTPTLVCQGNHEREKQADGNDFRPWLKRFGDNVPKRKGTPFYYSADVGPVHFVSISPYVDFAKTSAQYKWLEADLAAMDRSKTPWLVVIFHAPWYVTTVSHFQENECHRQITEPLLYKYGADVVLHGHSHVYERSNKMYNYQIDGCGATYITIGNAGVGLNTQFADSASYAPTLTNTSRFNATGPCPLPNTPNGTYVWLNTTEVCTHTYENGHFCPSQQPDYSAIREPSFGPGTLEVINATHARWNYLRNADPDDVIAEDTWIVRDPSCLAKKASL